MLGDLPVNEVAREMIGAIILRVKEAGRSFAIIEGIRNPLHGYFGELIETKVLPVPNPAADLKFFVGKRADKKRLRTLMFCSQGRGPELLRHALAGVRLTPGAWVLGLSSARGRTAGECLPSAGHLRPR